MTFKKYLIFVKENLIALSTLILAIVTTFMAIGTWRLADITVEQFKIKSYPAFMVITEKIKVDSDSVLYKYHIHNKGEINAHHVTSLFVYVYFLSDKLLFKAQGGAYYEGEQRMTSMNFEQIIFKDSKSTIFLKEALSESNIENLKCVLIFTKFMVPYDKKYRYETFGYLIKENPEKQDLFPFVFLEISSSDRRNLVQKYVAMSNDWDESIKTFFEDYEY